MDKASLPIVRTSERAAIKRCVQMWWWAYRMGLKVPERYISDDLWLGLGVHEALAHWYLKGKRRGRHPARYFEEWAEGEMRAIRTYVDRFGEDWEDGPKFENAVEMGIDMLEGYVAHWGKDPQWQIIAIEQGFKVLVKRAGTPIAHFASRWDGVIRDLDTGRILLLEHKTANQIATAYLELDQQKGIYLAVADAVLRSAGVLQPDEHIGGIQYNFLKKQMLDDRPQDEDGNFLNKDGTVSKRQPGPQFVRPEPIEMSERARRGQLEHLANDVAVMNAYRDGTIPVIKNTRKDCVRCDFFEMCKLHERGSAAWKEVAKSRYDVQDPYEDMRKSASE